MQTKLFDTADVLSVASGVLVSQRGIGAIYDVLNWMTGENLFTHQLPRVAREATPVIISAHPLIGLAINDDGALLADDWRRWIARWENEIGPQIALPKMTADQHERIDPLSEIGELKSPEQIKIIKI